jgi:hypothetical protein
MTITRSLAMVVANNQINDDKKCSQLAGKLYNAGCIAQKLTSWATLEATG